MFIIHQSPTTHRIITFQKKQIDYFSILHTSSLQLRFFQVCTETNINHEIGKYEEQKNNFHLMEIHFLSELNDESIYSDLIIPPIYSILLFMFKFQVIIMCRHVSFGSHNKQIMFNAKGKTRAFFFLWIHIEFMFICVFTRVFHNICVYSHLFFFSLFAPNLETHHGNYGFFFVMVMQHVFVSCRKLWERSVVNKNEVWRQKLGVSLQG